MIFDNKNKYLDINEASIYILYNAEFLLANGSNLGIPNILDSYILKKYILSYLPKYFPSAYKYLTFNFVS